MLTAETGRRSLIPMVFPPVRCPVAFYVGDGLSQFYKNWRGRLLFATLTCIDLHDTGEQKVFSLLRGCVSGPGDVIPAVGVQYAWGSLDMSDENGSAETAIEGEVAETPTPGYAVHFGLMPCLQQTQHH